MAKETSILKLKGKLDGMTFYKTSDGYQVRAKGGIERERIMNDSNFVRTRENMSEFGNINSTGKMIRDGIGNFLKRAKDSRCSSRLVSLIAKIKNLDPDSKRGERTFADGIKAEGAKSLLEGFSFNQSANLSTILKAPYNIDAVEGKMTIPKFKPSDGMEIPEAATHITIGYCCCSLNPENMASETTYAEKAVIPKDADEQDTELKISNIPITGSVKLHCILIEFLQEVNGQMYPLRNGSYNALQIVKVV